jgi:hypothetical protein
MCRPAACRCVIMAEPGADGNRAWIINYVPTGGVGVPARYTAVSHEEPGSSITSCTWGGWSGIGCGISRITRPVGACRGPIGSRSFKQVPELRIVSRRSLSRREAATGRHPSDALVSNQHRQGAKATVSVLDVEHPGTGRQHQNILPNRITRGDRACHQ